MTGPKLTPVKQNVLDRKRIKTETAEFLAKGGKITYLSLTASAWDEKNVVFMPNKQRGIKSEQDAPDT